ncbi:SDR family oxidoreductase [Sphingomonas sp. 2SG]|uniref:SDR family NAD(P)-dependent oxidoreductase n=1 Tax=Sphingomonas sp. 2SG TaxID=2502201 RepID=UPI0010F8821F|nr:SDR family oxidoreductase [Sphingomonas sp. 2SG]
MTIYTSDVLSGRHLLVTGASSGLGRAAALAFAEAGARLTLMGRDTGRLDETRARLAGERHAAVATAFNDLEATAEAVKAIVSEHGTLDGVFHAAGTELVRPMRMFKNNNAAELFGAALYGSLGIARAAASRGVLSDGASLVIMSSVAGLRGTAGMVGYSAAKAAVDGVVRSLACELAPRRIRVNSIAAGAVETEMHARLAKTLGESAIDQYERRHLLGFGRPADITNAAMFLLSSASTWITGTTLMVDGGYTAQ